MIRKFLEPLFNIWTTISTHPTLQLSITFLQEHDLFAAMFIFIAFCLLALALKWLSRKKGHFHAKKWITTPLFSTKKWSMDYGNFLITKSIQLILTLSQFGITYGFVRLIYWEYPILNTWFQQRYIGLLFANIFVWTYYIGFSKWMRDNKYYILRVISTLPLTVLKWAFLKQLTRHFLAFGASLLHLLVIIPIISIYLSFLESHISFFASMLLSTRAHGIYVFIGLWVFRATFTSIYVDIIRALHSLSSLLSRNIRVRKIALIRYDQIKFVLFSSLKGVVNFLSFLLFFHVSKAAILLVFLGTLPDLVKHTLQLIFSGSLLIFLWLGASWVKHSSADLIEKSELLSRIFKRLIHIDKNSPFNSFNFDPFIRGFIQSTRYIFILLCSYFGFVILLRMFPNTYTLSQVVLGHILRPLTTLWTSFTGFIPNIVIIASFIFITNYVMNFAKFVFEQIEKGNLSFSGFHKDVALPTYKIVRFLIFVFAVVLIFPYLPGAQSPAFKGVSVFLGVLFSLGSSTFVANVISGIMLTYMRPFKIGDRVKIADTVGDVVEKSLLVTRIKTVKNIFIAIPNAQVLGTHITNFSFMTDTVPVILHTKITIGYDVPWKTVHSLLIEAASITPKVLKTPAPFVQQTQLSDFYVEYELNVHTTHVHEMAAIYSALHANIQHTFAQGNVEITSPHFRVNRQTNASTIPPTNDA